MAKKKIARKPAETKPATIQLFERARAREAQKPACQCFTVTGELNHDRFTEDKPEEASAVALLGETLCQWEAPDQVDVGTLQQLAEELDLLSTLDFDGEDAPTGQSLRFTLANMASRARVACEVAARIRRLPPVERAVNAASGIDQIDPDSGSLKSRKARRS